MNVSEDFEDECLQVINSLGLQSGFIVTKLQIQAQRFRHRIRPAMHACMVLVDE